MGWRFRRTAQIVPGLRLNLSRSGPSVSAARVRTFPSASPGQRSLLKPRLLVAHASRQSAPVAARFCAA